MKYREEGKSGCREEEGQEREEGNRGKRMRERSRAPREGRGDIQITICQERDKRNEISKRRFLSIVVVVGIHSLIAG